MRNLIVKGLIVLSVVLCITSCGTGQSTSPYSKLKIGDPPPSPIGKNVDMAALTTKNGGRLGRACRLITADEMAAALGKTKEDIKLSNATPRDADPNQTACFYKWDDPDLFNAGIFIQLLKNPMGDDFPDYVSQFILQKRTRGEQQMDGPPSLFKPLDWGDDGSYDVESAKYYWRLGEEVVFALAFNTVYTPKEQYQIATDIATRLTHNYINK